MRAIGRVLQPVMGGTSWALTPLKPAVQPPTLPVKDAVQPIPPTSRPQLEEILRKLDAKKDEWAKLPAPAKAAMLKRCLDTTLQVAEELATVSTNVKGSYANGIGEEHQALVPLVSGLREYVEALQADGAPPPAAVRTLPSGQHAIDVFPTGLEAMLFGGWSGETWVEPGREPTQGTRARGRGVGGVALVLGAGNQAPVAPLDVLHKLVAEDTVVICKMNPVNEYVGPYLSRALSPLVEAGYVEFVYGGGAEGAFLTTHPLVTSILLTGSAATYDAIVWGKNDKTMGKKALDKPVDGELGCITPYIITPGGEWSAADLDYHAEQVVTGLVHNAGHNCLAAEVVVTAAEWPQRQAFLDALRRKLGQAPPRVPYYPGSDAKAASFCRRFPDAETFGDTSGAAPPWRLKTGLTPDQVEGRTENWCGVLQEVALPGADLAEAPAFLPTATAFANDRLDGNLSCTLLVHPRVEAVHPQAVQDAIAALRYGSVCVNVSAIMGFCITRLPWGAFPGNPPEDIQSGNCATHNTMLVDYPQKGVLKAPWIVKPAPFWSPFCRAGDKVAGPALKMMAYPSVINMTPLAIAALLG